MVQEKFGVDKTLRFPRCHFIRHDKDWNQCLTLAQLHELDDTVDRAKVCDGIFEQMVQDSTSGQKKRRRAGGGGADETGGDRKKSKAGTVVEGYQFIDTSGTRTEFKTFSGLEFCVLTVAPPHTKADVVAEVKRHGGANTANYSGRTNFLVAASESHMKVQNFLAALRDGLANQVLRPQ